MSKFITSANKNITVNEDASFPINDALHVKCTFTSKGTVAANTDLLEINVPKVGDHAEVGYFNTASDSSNTAAIKVVDTVSSVDGLHKITMQMEAATADGQEYSVEGWVKLPSPFGKNS